MLPFIIYTLATSAVYLNKADCLKRFGFNDTFPLELIIDDLNKKYAVQIQDNCLFDPETGLKVLILEQENTILITFGQLSSSNKLNISDDLKNCAHSNLRLNGIKNVVGGTPRIYEEAAFIIETIKKYSECKEKEIILTGKCVGASLASYCGLKHEIKTVGINPLPLGPGLQQSLGGEKINHAEQYVTYISARGDWSSDLFFPYIDAVDRFVNDYLKITTAGNFGKKYIIPSAHNSLKETHNNFLDSALLHCGYPAMKISELNKLDDNHELIKKLNQTKLTH
jgi:hypothetical protein